VPKFLAVHTLLSPTTFEEATPIAKKAKAESTVDAYWVGAWSQLNNAGKITKIFCHWNASSIEAVRSALAKIPCPVEDVYPLAIIDGEDFR
jgi:hypothetical protein